jgi:class 3 adenylate cyclase/predicted ATPase
MVEARKYVTVVFADVSGSTALGEQLDPETLRRVMERYFAEARRALEQHGGTVEKFIGDAVMAVFGIPAAHEDDALRAVKAAADMRAAIAGLNESLERERGLTLAVRTGINTGEVVAGDPSGGEFFASGDAVNVAARLEQAAAPGEILLGEETYRLVRDAVGVERLRPRSFKGKAEVVAPYRLLGVIEGSPAVARRFDTPFVGRKEELARLLTCFERSVTERTPALVTVLGPAGIGKTRLAAELVASVTERATVVQGRCLSYGEGITFWPLEEILRGLPDRPAGAPDPEEAYGTEETFWAYRKLFEALAQERPLLLVLEDIHWAEPTLLELIEHVVEWTRDAPMLFVCLARPELLERRPGWPGERLELGPLPSEEAETLGAFLAAELDQRARAPAFEAAEGNPLFLEQLLALAQERQVGEISVPHTIQSLLAARLDGLAHDERGVLEAAAVVGKEFWRGALLHLSPPGAEVSALLQRLVRKRLILPEHSSFPGEDAFRFGHILIRDAVYTGTTKESRTDLHERFAGWLKQAESPYEEIIGYHLEQAYRYRAELGAADDHSRQLAGRAGFELAAAGRRALQRGDMAAAANLLERAASLLPGEDPQQLDVLLDLGSALARAKPHEADTVLAEAIDAAQAVGDRGREWRARLERSLVHAHVDPKSSAYLNEELLREARDAASVFEQLGDVQGLARAWRSQTQALYWMGKYRSAAVAAERTTDFAAQAGDRHARVWGLQLLARSLYDGPTPHREAIRRCEEILAAAGDDRALAAGIKDILAALHTTQGNTAEARLLVDDAIKTYEDLGNPYALATGLGFESAGLHRAEGDLAAAERDLRRALDLLTAMGEKGVLSTLAARLADLLTSQDREQEAEHFLHISEESAGADDWVSQSMIKEVRASLLARRGESERAVTLAREAFALAEDTDDVDLRAWRRIKLAELLRSAGESAESARLLEEAIDLFEAKENPRGAEAARQALAGSTPAVPPF